MEDNDLIPLTRVLQVVEDLTEYLESRTTVGTAYAAGVTFSAAMAVSLGIPKEEFLDYCEVAYKFAKESEADLHGKE